MLVPIATCQKVLKTRQCSHPLSRSVNSNVKTMVVGMRRMRGKMVTLQETITMKTTPPTCKRRRLGRKRPSGRERRGKNTMEALLERCGKSSVLVAMRSSKQAAVARVLLPMLRISLRTNMPVQQVLCPKSQRIPQRHVSDS